MARKKSSNPAPFSFEGGQCVAFTYRNWRGEVGRRRVAVASLRFGATKWHPEPQWLLNALDLDKKDFRDFALKDIVADTLVEIEPA